MMRKLSAKELTQLKEMGSLFMNIGMCALVLEISLEQLVKEVNKLNSECYKAYYTGYYTSELEVRKSVIGLAKAGSSPAQSLAATYLKNCELDNNHYGITTLD